MRKALSENVTLRSMLELKNAEQYPLIACDVINKSSIQMRNLVTINKGSSDGIQVGMSVVSVSGLAGTIIGVHNNYAMVELLNNKNVKIPATLSESKCEGVIS
jgi:rod shape-determining protein MreC